MFLQTVEPLPASYGPPKGLVIDKSNYLWTTHFGSGQLTRWNANIGKEVFKTSAPQTQVTGLIFGGPALDTIYISNYFTAGSAGHIGSLFSFKYGNGVTGYPTYAFGG